MKYLLDTNICIYIINERSKRVLAHFNRHAIGDVGISSITMAELAFGVTKSGSARNWTALEAFLLPLEIAVFDAEAARAYGKLRTDLERTGHPFGPLDTLIAAHALSLRAAFVTNNVREFSRVNGLAIENWAL